MKEALIIFTKNMKFFMDRHGYSQTDIAKKLGVSSQAVSKWCRGVSCPDWDLIDGLCNLFGCNRRQLLEVEQTDDTLDQTPYEQRLLAYYDRLNPDGIKKVLEFLQDMNPKFFKED